VHGGDEDVLHEVVDFRARQPREQHAVHHADVAPVQVGEGRPVALPRRDHQAHLGRGQRRHGVRRLRRNGVERQGYRRLQDIGHVATTALLNRTAGKGGC
jgi:hypothetical protein